MMFCASLGAQRQSSSWRVCQCEGDPGDTEHTRCHVLRECMVALADGRSVGAASTVQRNIIYITVFCISLFREGPYSVFQICGNPCIPHIPYSRKILVEHCQGLSCAHAKKGAHAARSLAPTPRAAREHKKNTRVQLPTAAAIALAKPFGRVPPT